MLEKYVPLAINDRVIATGCSAITQFPGIRRTPFTKSKAGQIVSVLSDSASVQFDDGTADICWLDQLTKMN